MNYDFFTTEDMEAFRVLSSFLVSPAHPVIQRSIATKDLSASTNSPLERGVPSLIVIQSVAKNLECIRFVCFTHPQPLSRGELVYVPEILRFTPFRSG